MKTKPRLNARAVQRSRRILRRAGVAPEQIGTTLQELCEVLLPAVTAPAAPRPASGARPRSAVRTAGRLTRERLQQATGHFERGLALEASDLAEARKAYTAALAAHGGHLEATINLGRLLHLNGELQAAEKVYRDARHSSAMLSFNLALLLEDLKRDEEAMQAYREALALDPQMHEAHFHLGLLHERHERPREALRHLLAFRRSARK